LANLAERLAPGRNYLYSSEYRRELYQILGESKEKNRGYAKGIPVEKASEQQAAKAKYL
jgi:hypothetical protein